jgi:hypothetical protein
MLPSLFCEWWWRWNSPYINHFLSADTIVSDQTNPQGLNRYSYVKNNPIRFIDPSGHMATQGCGEDGKGACIETDPIKIAKNAQHIANLQHRSDESRCRNGEFARCSGVQGFQIQFTISAGMATSLTNSQGDNISPNIFYGISLVFDKHGGFQIFGLTRDISFTPYYNSGPADHANPSTYTGAGLTLAGGTIYGSQFAAQGTSAYGGRSVDKTLGYGDVSVDHYDVFNASTGTTDGTQVSGDDIGLSLGTPASGGSFAINSHPWFPRIGPAIQDPWAR